MNEEGLCKKCGKFKGYVRGYCSVCSKTVDFEEVEEENDNSNEVEGEQEKVEKCRKCKGFFGYLDGLCSVCAGVSRAPTESSCNQIFERVKDKYILEDRHFRRIRKVFETNKFKLSSKDCHNQLFECENKDPYLSFEQANVFFNIFKECVDRKEFWKYEHVFSHKILDYWNVPEEFGTGYCYYSMGRRKPDSEREMLSAIEGSQRFYSDQFRSFF